MADHDTTEGTGPADASNNPQQGGSAPGAPQDAPGAPLSSPAPGEKSLGTDIAKILEEVKLPERHDAPPEKQIENKAATFDTALGAQPTQENSAEPPPPQPVPKIVTPQNAEDAAPAIVPVHTLKDDLQEVVKEDKISVVRAVSLEEDRRTREGGRFEPIIAPAPRTHRIMRTLFAIVLLFALGAAALAAVYFVMQARSTPPPAVLTSSILFAESSVSVSVSGKEPNDLKQTLASAIHSLQGPLGSITEVVPTVTATDTQGTVTAATFSQFMQAIGAQPPDELLRALGDQFFFGVHIVDTNAPVFVIPVTSYDHAFAGMLVWESTMDADLAPIFPSVPAFTTDASGLPQERTFQDDVMSNYDVRELKDDTGVVRLYYSFPSQNILVIAQSPYSFTEVLNRLQAARHL